MLTELTHEGSQNLILAPHMIFTFGTSFFCFTIILFLIPLVGAIFFSPAEFVVAILQAQVVDDGTGDDQF